MQESSGEEELKVRKIRNGTVIDHIRKGYALSVLRILGITHGTQSTVTVSMNVQSTKMQRKDVVKVEDLELEREKRDKIALVAPNATINIVRNYSVAEKRQVDLPSDIEDIIVCTNPSCITNASEPVTPNFTVTNREPLVLRCNYCNRDVEEEDVLSQF